MLLALVGGLHRRTRVFVFHVGFKILLTFELFSTAVASDIIVFGQRGRVFHFWYDIKQSTSQSNKFVFIFCPFIKLIQPDKTSNTMSLEDDRIQSQGHNSLWGNEEIAAAVQRELRGNERWQSSDRRPAAPFSNYPKGSSSPFLQASCLWSVIFESLCSVLDKKVDGREPEFSRHWEMQVQEISSIFQGRHCLYRGNPLLWNGTW